METRYSRPRGRNANWWFFSGVRRRWPFLVWLGCAALTWYLWETNPHMSQSAISGVVDSEPILVAPVETARIRALHVKEGDRVNKGDILAEMDTALVDHGVTADLVDTVRIESSFGDTHQDVLQAISQRLDAIAQAKSDLATCLLEWSREKAELRALKVEQQRRDVMHKDRLLEPALATELLPQIAALEDAMTNYPAVTDGYRATLSEAEQYYADIMAWLGAGPDETISDAIRRKLQQGPMDLLLSEARVQAKAYREAYSLRADKDAIVAAVFRWPGEVVPAGEPILRLVVPGSTMVRGYIPEDATRTLVVGQQVQVRSAYANSDIVFIATVETVDVEVRVNSMTMSMSGRPIPVLTRQAILRLKPGHSLIAGERVSIHPVAAGQFSLSRILTKLRSNGG